MPRAGFSGIGVLADVVLGAVFEGGDMNVWRHQFDAVSSVLQYRSDGRAMKKAMSISVLVLALMVLLGVGDGNAGCAIDSPKGTPVTLARSRADSFSIVDISWENEQMANGAEHLIKWHCSVPKKPGGLPLPVEIFV